MLKEHREQRIARLLIDYQNMIKDLAFDDERIERTFGPAKYYYTNQKRLDTIKCDKIRNELEKLRAVQ